MKKYKSILITGASGFVGAHLTRFFANTAFEVTVLGRQKEPHTSLLQTGVKYYCADITKDPLPESADIIIHTAGLASDQSTWDEFYIANVIGTKNIFSQVKHKLFIYISSSSVYPISNKTHIENEIINTKRLNDYGRSKLQSEQYLNTKETVVILRPRAIYGTHDRILIPRILDMKKGNSIITPCKLNNRISMTNIDNLIEAINLCIFKPEKAKNQIFNIVDEETYNLQDVITILFSSIYNLNIPIRNIPFPVSKVISTITSKLNISSKLNKTALDMICHNNTLSIQKAKTILGYNPKINFENTVPEIVKWLKSKDLNNFINNPKNASWD